MVAAIGGKITTIAGMIEAVVVMIGAQRAIVTTMIVTTIAAMAGMNAIATATATLQGMNTACRQA